jgi:hypothetical protein
MDRAVRAGHPERSIARSGDAVASAAGVAATPTLPSPTLQRHFSFATYCCWRAAMCCLGVDSLQASASVAHIDALLDLDDELTPGSSN